MNVMWVDAQQQNLLATFTISGPWPFNSNSPDPWPLSLTSLWRTPVDAQNSLHFGYGMLTR